MNGNINEHDDQDEIHQDAAEDVELEEVDEIHDDDDDNDDDVEEEEEDRQGRNADGSFNGGVAVAPNDDGTRKRQSECDLTLFLECMETFEDICPYHTVLKPGVSVSIGLDKNTRLSAVFARYVEFCNEQYPSCHVSVSDLDFVHCTILNGSDTSEGAALMKNDHISVKKNSTEEREANSEHNRLQRETDREYFREMRMLLPDTLSSKTCDILLDCRGKLVDENGQVQEVLRTNIRGHSVILSKRCKWLADIIQNARDDLERQSVVTVPEQDSQEQGEARAPPVAGAMPDEDDYDGIEVLPYAPEHNDEEHSREAAEIEDDDDEDVKMATPPHLEQMDMFSSAGSNDLLWVTIPNHPPDAARLLLEYCYTNRVVPLGQDAFLVSCRTKGDRRNPFAGPVSPYHNHSSRSRGWPNQGEPVVSFSVALAGIALAEEAKMKRLSLMCEVAASQLVESCNVVEALSRCTAQEKLTGNPLPRLRKAAVGVMFSGGQRGVVDLTRTPTFRRALEEKSSTLVPALLIGTMEAMGPVENKKKSAGVSGKKELSQETQTTFEELDREDIFHRDMERRKRRAERRGNNVDSAAGGAFIHEEEWNTYETSKKSSALKRVSNHSIFSLGRERMPKQRRQRRS